MPPNLHKLGQDVNGLVHVWCSVSCSEIKRDKKIHKISSIDIYFALWHRTKYMIVQLSKTLHEQSQNLYRGFSWIWMTELKWQSTTLVKNNQWELCTWAVSVFVCIHIYLCHPLLLLVHLIVASQPTTPRRLGIYSYQPPLECSLSWKCLHPKKESFS